MLAACSLIYELLIAQLISVFAGNTVVWYALTIGVFLVGMGIGSLLVGPLLQRSNPVRALFWTEAALCLLGALSPHALHIAALDVLWTAEANAWFVGGGMFFLAAICIALTIGVLTGIELPLLMQLARGGKTGAGKPSSPQLLAADYFGSLAGALSFSLLLWPKLEPTQIGPATAGLNLLVAAVVAGSVNSAGKRWVRLCCSGLLSAIITALAFGNEQFLQFFLPRYYAFVPHSVSFSQLLSPEAALPQVSRRRSAYHTIDLVKSPHHDRSYYVFDLFSDKFRQKPDFPRRFMLFLNGEVQFFGDFEEVYHEFFAHVPIAAFDRVPRRALVLGGGDGLLLRELVKYSGVESVTLVDLDPEMIDFARSNPIMSRINDRAFEDPRVNVIIEDAYHFVRTSSETFDAVFLDFPEIADYNLARLYSREFYHFLLQRLAPGGFAAMNAGEIEYLTVAEGNEQEKPTANNRWPLFFNTLSAAGFGMITPFFSRLEHENERALERAVEYNLMDLPRSAPPAARKAAGRLFLRYNSASLRSGFIMAAKEKRPLSRNFGGKAAPLFVLNAARYRMALESPLHVPPRAPREGFNSVFRPQPSGRPPLSLRRPLRVYEKFSSNS